MLTFLESFFSYDFLVRGFIVGSLVSLCAALLGVTLVLKRYSMIGDGLAHVGFGALSIALAMNMAPLKVAIPIVILSAILLLRISESSKIKGDAAIALISVSSIALGVIVTSLSGGLSVDVYSYMFGSILAMGREDVVLSVILSIAVLLLFIVFYHKIFAITFDESFSAAIGMKVKYYRLLIALLTACTIVVGMRIMGTMLISGLIIFPALSSMRVFHRFRFVIIGAAVISLFCFWCGMMLSFGCSLPTGASIVVVNLGVFILLALVGTVTWFYLRRKENEQRKN